MRRAPGHAGRLSRWERLTFAVVFTLMASFVAIVAVSAARARQHNSGRASAASGTAPAGPATDPAWQPLAARGGGGTPDLNGRAVRDSADQELSTALAPVLARSRGNIAVGVVDLTTGARAGYAGRRSFPAAGIARADILAALLLQHQGAAGLPGRSQRELARRMVQDDAIAAAARLWGDVGGAAGLTIADARLHLRHTTPGGGSCGGLTSTTARDQLRLLTAFASARSPLSAASRSYALGLLRHVQPGQAWGVTEAASPGTSSAVQDGWLAVESGRLWVEDSIGVIHRGRQILLVAVLSDDQPTQTAGIDEDEAAAVAAAGAIARPAPARPALGGRQSG